MFTWYTYSIAVGESLLQKALSFLPSFPIHSLKTLCYVASQDFFRPLKDSPRTLLVSVPKVYEGPEVLVRTIKIKQSDLTQAERFLKAALASCPELVSEQPFRKKYY